jgi:GntR family transcriptional repressor for pyruvate dehydrogenase complex
MAWEQTQPKKQKLSEQIAEQILGQIAGGIYRPGERLPSEAALRQQLGVGRASLREALLRLAGMGVLDIRHGSGMFVEDVADAGLAHLDWGLMLESRQILNLIEARKLLEVQTVALAAERASEEDLAAMRACLLRMRAAPTRAEYIHADLDFHRQIARGTGNDVLVRLLNTLRNLTERTVWQSPTPKPVGVAQHEEIFRAIEARNSGAAREAMYAHLHEVEARTRQLAGESEGARERGPVHLEHAPANSRHLPPSSG